MQRLPLVSPLDRVLFLRAQDYIRGQPPELLSALAMYTDERAYAAGALIRPEGQPVERILFLAEGRIETHQQEGAGMVRRAVEAPGVVGLPHHFAGATSAPGVRALDDTLCLELDAGDLDQILEDHFSLLLQFAERSGTEILLAQQLLGEKRPDEPGFDPREHLSTPVELDLVHRLALVRRMPFFKRANLTVLGQLIRFEELARFQPGESLWKPGETVDSMALILDGRFRLRDGRARVDAPAGSVLGAYEILGREGRVEHWVAEQPSRVLFVRRELFIDLLEDHHDFAQSYLAKAGRTIVETWEKLRES